MKYDGLIEAWKEWVQQASYKDLISANNPRPFAPVKIIPKIKSIIMNEMKKRKIALILKRNKK